jgi:chromosome partitioning protein
MGKIISVSNQKGGVGKTTTAVNVAAFMAEKGKRVLIIDIDPQANAGYGIGINAEKNENTIYEVLIGTIPLSKAVMQSDIERLFIVPSNIHLAGAQVDLLDMNGKEYILRNALKDVRNQFDYIIIDCPPSLGILTLNSLAAADSVLIPLQCEYFALEGLNQLLRIIAMVQENLNRNLAIEGVVLTMHDSRTNLSQQVVDDVREYFSNRVFTTIIPRNIRLSEAPSFGKPIGLYDRTSIGSTAYENLTVEVLKNG